jgi:putative addiction module killer protein
MDSINVRDGARLTIREYVADNGATPFRDWLATLDMPTRARIQARVLRFELGNLGDHKSVGAGVWEARLFFGAGYRVYFGKEGRSIILLLLGGSKSSQRTDVRRARGHWHDYLEMNRHGKTE